MARVHHGIGAKQKLLREEGQFEHLILLIQLARSVAFPYRSKQKKGEPKGDSCSLLARLYPSTGFSPRLNG
jgi:hypothetical protein